MRTSLLGALLLAGCAAGRDGPADANADAPAAADGPTADAAAADGPSADAPAATADGSLADAAPADAGFDPTLPHVHDHTASSPARVEALVRRALDGLGFPAGAVDGPQPGDRVFVGKRYLAWIDQTGFAGKLNGLWRLNGADGDALDFAVTDPDGRPVNFFLPGEDGDGRWPGGYPGAEHIEFPNRTPEPDDDPGCASSDWCNQYGVNEAPDITNPAIPWWSACNAGAPPWSQRLDPVVAQPIAGGLKLVYEAPLVKEADGDGTADGDACHQDYLFADGVRRRVYLRLGYELHADEDFLDRTMQIRNPAGNPAFDGPMSLIGGFVVTGWPAPHYLKRISRYLRPETRDVVDGAHSLTLAGGQFTAHPATLPSGDEVYAWLDQPITLSVAPSYARGRSATLSHVGPSDNQDVGFCLCRVHGGLELGGGLIHGGVSLPIAGGASSIEARRRLSLPGAAALAAPTGRTYEAEALAHKIGRADGDGWSAATALDASDHLLYGPYATDWGAGSGQAVFLVQVDNNSADDLTVVTLEVNDATADQVVASRRVTRREWRAPFAYQRFALDFDLAGRAGHAMEVRVYWHDVSYVKVDKVLVFTADPG